jgi:hypothetical protein
MRAHLLSSELPALEGSGYTMPCGAKIQRAKFALIWDSQVMGEPAALSTMMFCKKCVVAFGNEVLQGTGAGARRYLFGIVEATSDEV